MHLLASSRAEGCRAEGPHVHVRRPTDNPNRALAKSRFPRMGPSRAERRHRSALPRTMHQLRHTMERSKHGVPCLPGTEP